ncbi:MAG: F0F1 ATP synthase subunit A [Bacteroidales bacterium]|nr:F0F1 ATP synthase subunit A [Bacteroidales bacterium]
MLGKGSFRFSLVVLISWVVSFNLYASDNEHHGESEEFNAGRMIIEHIIDSHDWHILDIGKTQVSLPLPIILYYENNLDIFMSSKFHHGHESYKGYKLESEGENKGKIVRVLLGTMETDESASIPLDLSITKNVFAIFISILILCVIFISVGNAYKKRKGESPHGLQSFMEPLIIFIKDDIAKASIGEKNHERYLPFLLTLFFFILLNNLLGLVPFFPGGANITGNIAVTGIMAVFTFLITTFSGNKNYWAHIFNTPGVPWWLKIPVPLMPIVELMGVFTKPFVLMIRLFANMTAGHIIVLGFVSLIFIFGNINVGLGYGVSVVSVAFMVFMGLLELLVAFIQAYVFTLLSALYFGMATEEHH